MLKSSLVLQVGFAQINPTLGDFEGNTSKIISFIRQAESRKLDLVIFPELAVTGYPPWDLANKTSFIEKNMKSIEEIARATKNLNVIAIVGYIHARESWSLRGRSHNALAVISKGRMIAKQFKTLLPNYDVFLEEIFFEPARTQMVLSIKGVKTGFSICEDLWEDDYAVKPLAGLKKKDVRIIINISASPFHRGKDRLRALLISRKAKQYGAFLFYANLVGAQDDLIFDGRSLVADPKGRIVFQADAFREGLFDVVIDLSRPMPAFKSKPAEEQSVTREIYEALVIGIQDYVRKNNFNQVLVGLSGGIDSALTATLAVDALGASRVCGITMPGPFSSQGSVEDSRKLAKHLGIEIRKHSISEIYQHKIKEIIENKKREDRPAPEESELTLAMENLQARLRALELMYVSNDESRLLLSTGNKSELAMGYCTLYGDMCGGLCVLGDVYKTEVYRLAAYRNEISQVIPRETILKPPSAELAPNQTDQDSLPPYEILDEILYRYIEGNKSSRQIQKLMKGKADGRVVQEVIRKVDHNEYKRRQAAPILRVTEKAWFGRRMPITNRFEISRP